MIGLVRAGLAVLLLAIPIAGFAQDVQPAKKQCVPGIGCVTGRPLPRYVLLKSDEGNARRGPGYEHRIDWVFTRVGMPLKLTAEFDVWRRVEDASGEGGWMHFGLLSGSARSVLVMQDLTDFLARPDDLADVVFQAEKDVVGRVVECNIDWCRVSVEGARGWVRKGALWGVDPQEIIE